MSKEKEAADLWGAISSLRVLLWGESGTGKTRIWSTFPGPILAIICSGGNKPGELLSIKVENRKKITPRIVKTLEETRRWVREAKDYATVVLDHVSGLQDLALREVLVEAGSLSNDEDLPAKKSWGMARQQDYGQAIAQTQEILRDLLNLPGNIVIVAQERVFGGREDGVDPGIIQPKIGASVMPSLARWLHPACDYNLQTFKRPKMIDKTVKVGNVSKTIQERGEGVEFCLRCGSHEVFMTKFRSGEDEDAGVLVNPSYEKLVKLINGERE